MKNDSGMYPVETPMDSWFDSNNDGELSGLETMQRDAMLYESYKQTSDVFEESSGYSPAKFNSYKYEPKKPTEQNNEPEPIVTGDWGQTICIVLAALILVGQFIVCAVVGSIAPMFIGTIIGVFLLWISGALTFG